MMSGRTISPLACVVVRTLQSRIDALSEGLMFGVDDCAIA